MFGRATIRPGIGPHSSSVYFILGIAPRYHIIADAKNTHSRDVATLTNSLSRNYETRNAEKNLTTQRSRDAETFKS